MNQEAQSIAKQIQELENLANEMLDAGNFNSEIFEQISQQIQEYQLQQKKLADEAKYLEEVDIQKIYQENGGKEPIIFAHDIITGEAMKETGLKESLSDHFNDFLAVDDESRVVFVNQDNHWLTVRLEKVNGGITYQVADSMPENPTKNKSNREEKIDTLLGGICTKILFKSAKQQNGYDCGIHCALNAVDMKTNLIDGVKYSNAKSTYSKYDVETIRENFEKEKIAKQKPRQTVSNTNKTNWYKPSLDKQQMMNKIKVLPKDEYTKVFNEARKLSRNNTPEFKHFAQAYTNLLEQNTNKPQPRSRLSSASTASSLSSTRKINTFTRLNNNSQRPLSASSLRPNISMVDSPQLKRQPSAINRAFSSLKDLISH